MTKSVGKGNNFINRRRAGHAGMIRVAYFNKLYQNFRQFPERGMGTDTGIVRKYLVPAMKKSIWASVVS